jgi:hypothetical protein
MPSQKRCKLCKCEICISSNPQGTWIHKSQMSGHLARQAVNANASNVELSATTKSAAELEAEVFFVTMTDSGPDLDKNSRLWSSRQNYGEPSDHHSSMLSPSISADIAAGAHHIMNKFQSHSTMPVQAPADPAILDVSPGSLTTQTGLSPQALVSATSSFVDDRRTEKNLLLLQNMSSKIEQLETEVTLSQLSQLQPSLEDQIAKLFQSLNSIVSRKPKVVNEKRRLLLKLQEIQECYYKNVPEEKMSPVHYNTGKV